MTECFKIQLLQFNDDADFFDLRQGKSFYQVQCLSPYLRKEPTTIVADPFLFVNGERLYLFYESKPWLSPAVIKMVSTADMKNWTKPKVVLQEPFHLSFPWVFEDDGQIYMIPESCENNSIRLYKAEDDNLTSFRFVDNLMIDNEPSHWMSSYCDTIIIQRCGKYYLFTTRRRLDGVNEMELYVSDNLLGDYHKHPASPIQSNNKVGRNAGSFLDIDGKLLRFSQDCTVRYGDNIHITELKTITPSTFEEKIVRENIIPVTELFYREGGHQFNTVKFKGYRIVATDAKEYHQLYAHRILNKVMRMFHC